jgi:dTDP-4-dehydrorhamnose reductase
MNILVTGANGQLGMALQALSKSRNDLNFLFTDLPDLDISNYHAVEKAVQEHQTDVLVNCASYNTVDKAEEEPMTALLVNGKAVQGLAGLAKKYDFGFVHLSTDYIFDGKKGTSYSELDDPHPQSKYAHSKYIGEQAVNTANPRAAIIRTSWLYSEYAHNFVKTMIRLGKEKESLKVVNDQYGSPTYAGDLAEVILTLLPDLQAYKGVDTYNYSNEGVTNWAGFAEKIMEYADLDCKIIPVSTEEYGQSKASRPAYSLLDKTKIKEAYKLEIPEWQESLKKCIKNLLKK